MYNKIESNIISLFQPVEQLISILKPIVQENKSSDDLKIKLIEYSNSLEKILDNQINFLGFENDEQLQIILQPAKDYCSSFPEIKERFQDLERYHISKDDSLRIKTFKIAKSISLKAKWNRIKLANFIRSKRDKSQIEFKTRKQLIQQQQLAEYVFVNNFLEKLVNELKSILVERGQLFITLKELDYKITNEILNDKISDVGIFKDDLNTLSDKLDELKLRVINFFKEITPILEQEFNELEKIADTIEFPTSRISKLKLGKNFVKLESSFLGIFNRFNVQTTAVLEHWNLIHGIRKFCFQSIDIFNDTVADLSNLLNENYKINNDKVIDLLKKSTGSFDSENFDIQLVEDLNRQLIKEQVPLFLDQILKVEFVSNINLLNEKIYNSLLTINKTYNLPLRSNWENLHSSKQLKDLELNEIVEGWGFELIKKPLNKELEDLNEFQNSSIAYLNEISGIVEYANEYFHANVNLEKDKHIEEFKQGIDRGKKRSIERQKHNGVFGENLSKNLQLINSELINEITASVAIEQLKKKHVQMYRRRLLLDFKQLVFKYLNETKKFVNIYYLKIKDVYKQLRTKYSSYREVLGLSVSQKTINSDLSNYLSETEIAIEKLPLMYQRLFSLAPVENAKFRVCRPVVVEQLEKAYANWTLGKFAPTCIVGESGSGMTSLINEFVEKFGHQYQVFRISLQSKIRSEQELILLFNEVINSNKIKNIDDLRNCLSDSSSRKVIIIENIHRLYTRKMGGFDLLKQLFQLISQTNSKVYWLNTCLNYTYNYLEYSIGISNYYAYVAMLDKLSKEQVQETILNRHVFSGYNLNFIPPENFSEKRSFKKLSAKDQQKVLHEDYFKRLYNYAQNNLSLALLFWMRSVVSIDENTFNIQFKNLNFQFVNSLNNSQIATLYSMILHGSLCLNDHVELFDFSEQESIRQLMVFVDDGILVKKQDHYLINPLVYRQIVNHLTSLNYIH